MGEVNRNSKVIRISKEAYEAMEKLLDGDFPTMGALVDEMLERYDKNFKIPEDTRYAMYYVRKR